MSKLRSHRPSHAVVVAYLALFVALGGSSYAAIVVTGKNVKDSSLTGRDVKDSSLTGRDVKNSSLTTLDVRDESLLAGDFKPGQLPAGGPGPIGPKGDPCSAADPACRGPQGAAGEPGPGALKIAWSAVPYTYANTLASVGPWELRADCDGQGGTGVYLYVIGPGSVDYYVHRSTADAGPVETRTKSLPTGGGYLNVDDFSGAAPAGAYRRSAGVLILHSGDTVAEVELQILADQRTGDFGAGTCSVYGTAVPTG